MKFENTFFLHRSAVETILTVMKIKYGTRYNNTEMFV